MRFLIFVIDNFDGLATGDEMVAIDAFNDQLRADGNWIFAGGLSGPSMGTLIDNRAGADIAIGESLFNSPENYSGFWLIQADSHEIALRLAKAGSKACNRRVELRPLL